MPLAAWSVGGVAPNRLSSSAVDLEKNLEGWIADDPGLVDRGLVVLGRQLHLSGVGILDLLCVDQQGRLAILEIKRGKLIRETIAQAIDYASILASWPSESLQNLIPDSVREAHAGHPGLQALLDESQGDTRDVEIIVVGCGADAGIDRMIQFLGEGYGVPIRAVTFDVFGLPDGDRILVRDEKASENAPVQGPTTSYSLGSVIEKAGGLESATGRRMMAIVETATRSGLYARPYKYSVMFTPQQNRTRYLATIWRMSKAELVLTYSPDAFAEFFPISAATVAQILGPDRVEITTDEQAESCGERLERLFKTLTDAAEEGSGEAS